MAESIRRPTLRDVARRADCHYSTVSLALRNRPGVPPSTCERIRRAAAEIGYRPDPLLASLAAYRHPRPAAGPRAQLAWVTNFPTRGGWRCAEVFAEFFDGAQTRALALGFRLQEFWVREGPMSRGRASQVLAARGIEGLILAPQPEPAPAPALEWDCFSAVAIGYSTVSPVLHMIGPNQYRSMGLALRRLRERGYRRIGLTMLRTSDERVEHNWLAGFLVGQQEWATKDRLPPLMLERWDESVFAEWLRRTQPDVVLSKCPETLAAVRRLGCRVPRELGVALLSGVRPLREEAGIDEVPREVGAAAVDLVADMIHRRERGVPASPRRVLIDGAWIDGATVRRAVG